MKAVVFLLAFAIAGCSTQGAHSVPPSTVRTPSTTGPALQAPVASRRPMDTVGGPTGTLAWLNTALGDAAPVINGKTMAHLYIGVREVDAIANGQTFVLGTAATPVQMDLLQFQNGSTNWMTQTTVPAQTYTQLRYVLDIGSTQAVFADGSTTPVRFSGAATKSSYGVGASTTATADAVYADAIDVTVNAPISTQSSGAAVAADFNLTESLAPGGPAGLVMRPTLSAANGPGQIVGAIANAAGSPVQNATVVAVGSNGNAVNSATTDAAGTFNIHALPADTYQLVIYTAYTNAAGYRITASGVGPIGPGTQSSRGPTVSVTAGNTTSAGTIGE